MYKKIVYIVMTILSLMIISGCPYKNEILGFIIILIHHSITTYKLIKNINKKGFLSFKNFEFLVIMIILTALTKLSFGYTNGAYILNDVMGMQINPYIARIGVLLAVIILIILPMYFYDKNKK